MAACTDIDSDSGSSINEPGEVDFDVNQETASQYQDKVSSKSVFRLDLSYGVTRKGKGKNSHHYHCLHPILERKVMLLSLMTAKVLWFITLQEKLLSQVAILNMICGKHLKSISILKLH